MSHEFLNPISAADDDFYSFFSDLLPQLKDTIMIVLSDHGHRFDHIRETVGGHTVDKSPLLIKVFSQQIYYYYFFHKYYSSRI